MRLKVFGSNSKGNAYALSDDNGNTLLIECGVPVKEIKKHLDFKMEGIVGCLCSHIHGDHSKYVNQYLDAGIDVAMSIETAKGLKLENHHRVKIIVAGKKYSSLLNGFDVLPFSAEHDVPTFGFIIKHQEMGNCLFLTDSFYSKYKFANINNWIIECNHSSEIIESKLSTKSENAMLKNRIIQSHLSLENLLEIFRVNDMTKTNNIVLIHLSDTNSNEIEFKKTVWEKTGKNVNVASTGMEINLNLHPF
jgi:phosphoribosyl 1,2-cyclic phosphodiesterase